MAEITEQGMNRELAELLKVAVEEYKGLMVFFEAALRKENAVRVSVCIEG